MKTKFLLLFILTAVTLSFSSCDNKQKKEFESKIQKAESLQKEGKLEEAKALCLEAQKLYSKDKSVKEKLTTIEKQIEEKKDKEFNTLVLKANTLYEEGMYEEARNAYIEASNIKPSASEIQDKINEIDAVFSKPSDEEVVVENPDNVYHVIVGSFQNEAYASRLQSELIAKGFNSRIISRPDNFYAVSLTSHPNVHDAFNHINEAVAYHLNAWVVRE